MESPCIISYRLIFINLLYNRTHDTTKLKSTYAIKLIRMQRDLTYSKCTRNLDKLTQYLGLNRSPALKSTVIKMIKTEKNTW